MVCRLILVVALTLCFASAAQANRLDPQPGENFIIYVGDALATRPFTLGVTIVGAVIYVVSLPFTYFANDPTVYEVLVKQPAAATFTRCLGCPVGEAMP